jgi:predicted  nucleic acid-binding Zn-ribbon protein
MTISAEMLRELHHLHQMAADLKGRLDRGPLQVQAGQANVKRFEDQLAAAKEAAKKAKMKCDERQLQLKSNESRINDLKSKLNACSTNKEYQALKDQIAADEMANSVLSDEILEMFEKNDEHEGLVKAATELLTKGREELDKVTRRVSDELASLESQYKDVKARLAAAEAQLPTSFRADYDRVAKARGDEALAPLDGETCGGCSVAVTSQMISDLMMSRPVFCKSCGCLLYLPEKA